VIDSIVDPIRTPWDMLAGESAEDFEAFRIYLESDNVSKVSRKLRRQCAPISAAYRWRARKAAYVDALAREADAGALEGARSAGRTLGALAVTLREVAGDICTAHALRGDLSPRDALRVLEWASRTELLTSGSATERVALDLSECSEAETALLEKIVDSSR